MQNNITSTLLCIFLLGLIIYYLSQNKYDTFDSTPANYLSTDLNPPSKTKEPQMTLNGNLAHDNQQYVQHGLHGPLGPNNHQQYAQQEPEQLLNNSESQNHKSLHTLAPLDNKEIINPMYNYKDNDELFNYATGLDNYGADLNNAYSLPIPEGTDITKVNINKNNVDKYNAKDYLPQEINNKWFDTDFSQAQHNINDGNLINPDRFVIGINTVGQSLKNASYDIRGTIPNPKFSVSPWNNSTFEPDYNLKPLC